MPSNEIRRFKRSDFTSMREIGQGTMSVVYVATLDNQQQVAVKTLKSASQVRDIKTRKRLRADFENELKMNKALSNHENIISLVGYMVDEEDDTLLQSMVFEFCDGSPVIASTYGMSKLSDVLNICIAIAYALSHAHSRNIIHRDVKPSQIVTLKNGTPKLGDWGLATFSTDKQSLTGQTGTLEFMAPEVIRNEKYGTAADVFSFGVLMYCLLSGADYPYKDKFITAEQAADGVAKQNLRPSIGNRIPIALAQIMRMCWAEDATSRPTMDVVAIMLENFSRQQGKNILGYDGKLEKRQSRLNSLVSQYHFRHHLRRNHQYRGGGLRKILSAVSYGHHHDEIL